MWKSARNFSGGGDVRSMKLKPESWRGRCLLSKLIYSSTYYYIRFPGTALLHFIWKTVRNFASVLQRMRLIRRSIYTTAALSALKSNELLWRSTSIARASARAHADVAHPSGLHQLFFRSALWLYCTLSSLSNETALKAALNLIFSIFEDLIKSPALPASTFNVIFT